jgi:hypothetical protein
MRFEVLTAVGIKSMIFWYVMVLMAIGTKVVEEPTATIFMGKHFYS